MKILVLIPLILLLIPTSVFATEGVSVEDDSPWNFDIQYDYISLGDSYIDGLKKITTINLLLDSRINESTTIHGDFYNKTTKSNYNRFIESSPVTEKGIRELYIESEVTPNTTIMVGKKSFRIDNKKGIQGLGVESLFTLECETNQSKEFSKCLGVDSVYIKSKLSENLQIELLKTTNDKVYPSPIKGYKARLKHSTDEFDYYLTAKKDAHSFNFVDFYINQEFDRRSLELSIIENEDLDTQGQWFLKVKNFKDNSSTLSSYPTSNIIWLCLLGNGFNQSFSHSNGLTIGKVFKLDKLSVNAELNHNISTYNPNCSEQSIKKKIKSNTLSLMLEYPIENGKITSSHLLIRTPYENSLNFGYFPDNNNVNLSLSLVDVTYSFTKDISGRLGYQLFKFKFDPNSTYSYDSITYSMKYKF